MEMQQVGWEREREQKMERERERDVVVWCVFFLFGLVMKQIKIKENDTKEVFNGENGEKGVQETIPYALILFIGHYSCML